MWFLLAAALVARVWLSAAQDLTRTEAYSVGRATAECASAVDVISVAREKDIHPPLYYLWLWGLTQVVGPNLFFLKAVQAGMAVLTILVLWAWVREAAGAGPAFWAALLAAASGYHLERSIEMRMYSLNALWTALAQWMAWRYWHTDGAPFRRLLSFYVMAAVAALHTHYYALFAWAAVLAATFPESLRNSARRQGWWIAQGAILAAWLPWAVWGLGHQLAEGRTATLAGGEAAWITALQETPLRYFVANVREQSLVAAVAAALFVAAGYLLAFSEIFKKQEKMGTRFSAGGTPWISFLLVLVIVPLGLSTAYSFLYRPIYAIHYAVVAFPSTCALVGTGISRLWRPAAIAGAVLYLVAGVIALRPIAARGNSAFWAAAEIFLREGSPRDAVVVNAVLHSGEGFLFHLRRAGLGRGDLNFFSVHEDPTYNEVPWLTRWRAWDDPPSAAAEASGKIMALLARHRRVWFMNFSHTQGAFPALEERLEADFHPCRFDAGTARLFLIEERHGRD